MDMKPAIICLLGPQIDQVNVTSVNADIEVDDISRLIELATEDNLHEYEKMYYDYY